MGHAEFALWRGWPIIAYAAWREDLDIKRTSDLCAEYRAGNVPEACLVIEKDSGVGSVSFGPDSVALAWLQVLEGLCRHEDLLRCKKRLARRPAG